MTIDDDKVDNTEDIQSNLPDVFDELGCLVRGHNIKMAKSVGPVIHPPRRILFGLKDKMKAKSEKWRSLV